MFSHASLKGFNPKSILDRLLNMRQFVIDVPAGDILNIENIIETIYLEYSFRMKGWPDVICLELLRLLLLIDRFAHRGSQSAKKLQTEDPRIFMALKRFENDYHSESGITEVVKKSGMNQRYFIRLFKKYVGCPPLNYLNRLRIEKACEFLARTVQPVIQIAADVGFVDLANFNRLFKKYLNISPTHFRLSAHKNPNLTLPTRFDFPLKVKRS
jgi:AraC-like DNA-binding protein